MHISVTVLNKRKADVPFHIAVFKLVVSLNTIFRIIRVSGTDYIGFKSSADVNIFDPMELNSATNLLNAR